MRLYEVVYILDPALNEAAATSKLEKFHALATAQGGEVTEVDHWGNRQLAYPVAKQTTGYYVVAQFSAAAEALPEFERLLKLDEEVLRHLVVLSEGELAVPVSLGDDDEDDDRHRGGRGDDDDEEPRRDAGGDSDGDKDELDVEVVEGAEDEAGAEATAEVEEEADDDEDEAGAEGDEDTDEEDKD